MLFLLKKLIGNALMPLSLILLLQLLALALLARRKTRAAVIACVSGLGLLVLASNEGIADFLITRLELAYPPIRLTADGALPAPAASAQFILILGGGHNSDSTHAATGRLRPGSLSRLVEGVRLARLLPQARLLTCGPVPDHSPESHAAVLARAATELGIDPARITPLPDVRDTHDEVLAAHAIIGDAPVLLVTSAWHLPRAMGLAHKAGLHAIAAPCDYATSPIGNPATSWLRWSVFGLERSTWATREALGLAWTRLRGQR